MIRLGTRSRTLGVVMMLLSIAALVVGSVSGYQSRAYAQCQGRVNDQLVVALRARADATDERDRAFTALLDTLLSAPSQEERRAALAAYTDAQHKLESHRREHPLPAPPSDTCHQPTVGG